MEARLSSTMTLPLEHKRINILQHLQQINNDFIMNLLHYTHIQSSLQ